MKEFHSIESLRHVIKHVKMNCDYHGRPYPALRYVGSCKLHGTNAGVRVTENKVQAQSRSRILDIGNDNMGFAGFVKQREDKFRDIVDATFPFWKDITLYGEWCGSGIQAGVGVSTLPKHFVIFAAFDGETDQYINPLDWPAGIQSFNQDGIFNIAQMGTWPIEIDFNDPEKAAERITQVTLEVERECPWTRWYMNKHNMPFAEGVRLVGEGIVWTPVDTEKYLDTRLWFKSKGLEHQVKGGKKKVEVDPVKVANIAALVEQVLPLWRLEQGMTALRDEGYPTPTPKETGRYLKWVQQDVLKEEFDTITANGFEWKDVVSAVSAKARDYFLAEVQKG